MTRQASDQQRWLELEQAHALGRPVRIRVLKRVGLELHIDAGVPGRLSMSASGRTKKQLNELVGRNLIALTTLVDRRRGLLELTFRGADRFNVPVHGPLGPVEVNGAPPRAVPRPGDTVIFVTTRVTNVRVLGRVGTTYAQVPSAELSWDPAPHPERLTSKGQQHRAKVLAVDRGTGVITASVRQTQPDPLAKLVKSHRPDRRYLARAHPDFDELTKITIEPPFGCPATLAPNDTNVLRRSISDQTDHGLDDGVLLWVRLTQINERRRTINAKLDQITEGEPVPADPSWGVPMELNELLRWNSSGVGTHSAGLWAVRGFAPADAVRWIEASINEPEDAAGWVDLEIDPAEAADWMALDFTPASAAAWLEAELGLHDVALWDAGFRRSKERNRWIKGGRSPSDLLSWRDAGWMDLEEVNRYRLAGHTSAETAVAVQDATDAPAEGERIGHGTTPPAPPPEADPRLLPPDPRVRQGRARDQLFGSPRTTEDLAQWASGLSPGPGAWSPVKRPLDVIGAPRGSRLGATDVLALRSELDLRSRQPGWPERLADLNRAAVHVLADAGSALATVESEPPPDDALPSIVLPFPSVTVWFSARFELRREELTHLPGWDPDSERSALPYERWLAHLAEAGGHLAGVILQSGWSSSGLSDECVWIIEVEGSFIPIPSLRSRSALDGIADRLAMALCFGSWVRGVPGRRPPPGANRTSSTTSTPRSVHVIRYQPKRRTSKENGGLRGPAKPSHFRRGHWRRQRYGPRDNWHYEWVWIDPTFVGGAFRDHPDVVYRLPRLSFRTSSWR